MTPMLRWCVVAVYLVLGVVLIGLTSVIAPASAMQAVTSAVLFVGSIASPTAVVHDSGVIRVNPAIDLNRTPLHFYAVAVAAGTTGTETAITLTKAPGSGATSAAASFVVTSGKKFRITALTVAVRGHATATVATTTFNVRLNTAGACTTTSTPIVLAARVPNEAVANQFVERTFTVPDGYEITGDGTLQFCVTAAATYTTNAPTWDVTITGFEY
jgi:hypothetical protein